MTIDADEETRTEIKASLRVMGESLDPDAVSQLLDVIPDHSHRKGDPRAKARYAPYSSGLWLRRSRSSTESSLQQHLDELIGLCSNNIDGIRELQDQGFEIDISVGLFSDLPNIDFSIPKGALRRLAELDLSLRFDAYLM